MEERQLVIGGFYKHFKDKLYQVRGIAYHSETKEKMVVYQALYGDYAMYVRPFDMFMSEVDHDKYPKVTQKYRFEQVILDNNSKNSNQTVLDAQEEKKNITAEQEGAVDERLLRFLDAESFNEKLNVLTYLKSDLDDNLIDAMAASMEVEVPDGSIDERYRSLRSVVMAHLKYECTRLQK
ncbi:MAG: DUF1653 domain-containing protein [Eubacteriales bacterium]|nr:DUF1653 domain-containing protein [Eubacteriales bacterium]